MTAILKKATRCLSAWAAAALVGSSALSYAGSPGGGSCGGCATTPPCAATSGCSHSGGCARSGSWFSDVRHFWRDTRHEFAYEYHRNARWPYPYTEMAEDAVRQPLALQAENARLQMVSLWDYHFEPSTGKLNTMGRRRLQDIIDRTDTLGHTVYVRRAETAKETELRVAEVHKQLKDLNRDGEAFDVVEAKSSPSSVTGGEAQRAVKLLMEPSKGAASTTDRGGASEGYVSGGK